VNILGFEITAGTIVSVTGALGLSEILRQGVQWLKERRGINVKDTLAERTLGAQVDVSDVNALQAKLVFMQSIIESQAKYRDMIDKELTEALEREHKLRTECFELQMAVQSLKMQASQMQERCESLERRIALMGGTSNGTDK
jgi:hypothetical protein